jgi:hypothetical protein
VGGSGATIDGSGTGGGANTTTRSGARSLRSWSGRVLNTSKWIVNASKCTATETRNADRMEIDLRRKRRQKRDLFLFDFDREREPDLGWPRAVNGGFATGPFIVTEDALWRPQWAFDPFARDCQYARASASYNAEFASIDCPADDDTQQRTNGCTTLHPA